MRCSRYFNEWWLEGDHYEWKVREWGKVSGEIKLMCRSCVRWSEHTTTSSLREGYPLSSSSFLLRRKHCKWWLLQIMAYRKTFHSPRKVPTFLFSNMQMTRCFLANGLNLMPNTSFVFLTTFKTSRLKINLAKSRHFGVGVSWTKVESILCQLNLHINWWETHNGYISFRKLPSIVFLFF